MIGHEEREREGKDVFLAYLYGRLPFQREKAPWKKTRFMEKITNLVLDKLN